MKAYTPMKKLLLLTLLGLALGAAQACNLFGEQVDDGPKGRCTFVAPDPEILEFLDFYNTDPIVVQDSLTGRIDTLFLEGIDSTVFINSNCECQTADPCTVIDFFGKRYVNSDSLLEITFRIQVFPYVENFSIGFRECPTDKWNLKGWESVG
jgi:hypothetical protein